MEHQRRVSFYLGSLFLVLSVAIAADGQGTATSAEIPTKPSKNVETKTPGPSPSGVGDSNTGREVRPPTSIVVTVGGDDESEKQKPQTRKPLRDKVEVEGVSTSDWVENFFIQNDKSKIIMIRNNSKTRWITITGIFLHDCVNVAVKCNLSGGPTPQGGGWDLPPGSIGAFVPTMRSDTTIPMSFKYYYFAEFKK